MTNATITPDYMVGDIPVVVLTINGMETEVPTDPRSISEAFITHITNGRYRVTIGANNSTYLSNDIYDVQVSRGRRRSTVWFRSVTRNCGTFEDATMLSIYQRRGNIQLERIESCAVAA